MYTLLRLYGTIVLCMALAGRATAIGAKCVESTNIDADGDSTPARCDVLDSLPKHGAVQPSELDGYWRVANRCGVNSTYLLARLLECPVVYADIVNAIPIGESGSTMADIQQYLNSVGLSATVVKISPALLDNSLLPAIALFETDMVQSGHFVVVLSVSSAVVRIIDGTTGAVDLISRSDFEQRWTGNLLVARNTPTWPRYFYGLAITMGSLTVLYASLKYQHRRTTQ